MACPAVTSGNAFVSTVLDHIDCQAQSIGSFGYGAMTSANGPVAGLMLALLTIFIAIFGFRLMFGQSVSAHDGVSAVLKVAIVLTLATSWPAWRTLAYDVVFKGPGEVAASIAANSGLPYGPSRLEARLQSLDDGIVALTAFGTGRLTGAIVGSTDLGDNASGIALPDQSGLGFGRVAYLVGIIAPLGITRLGGGILLALAPLLAGLLLFGATRSLFFGYLRALSFCALGALGLALIYAAQLGVMEPWLSDALAQRQGNVLVPAAPTELLVLTLAFMVLALGWLGLLGRLLFFSESLLMSRLEWPSISHTRQQSDEPVVVQTAIVRGDSYARVQTIAGAMAASVSREDRLRLEPGNCEQQSAASAGSASQSAAGRGPRLGSSYRRTARRVSATAERRDLGQ